jgi:hypothetical protein
MFKVGDCAVDSAILSWVISPRNSRTYNSGGPMVKVSVFYPNPKGTRFDMSYYCTKHIPLVRQLLGPALKNVAVEEGIAGMTPEFSTAV